MKRAPFRLSSVLLLSLGSLLASGCASGGSAKEAPPAAPAPTSLPPAFASGGSPPLPSPVPPLAPLGQVGNVSSVAAALGAPTAPQKKEKTVESDGGGHGTTPHGVVPNGGAGLSEDAVQRAVQEQFDVFNPCYEHLSGKPRGQLQVKATITRSGAVSSVSVSDSTFRVARFDDCVGTAFQQIRFGASHASGVFLVPLAWGG
jgi:hypothetical protein